MTQSTPPSSWTETTIRGCLADEFPGAWGSEPGHDGPNAHILRSTNLDDDGHINFATAARRWIDEPHLTQRRLRDGDVLLESSGGGPGKPVGRVAHFQAPDSIAYLSSNFFRTLRPDETKVDSRFLAWRLLDLYRQPRIWNFQQQTTGIINLKTKDYLQQRFHLPEKPDQSRIAAVLDTVDEAIAKTEAVIAKLRQVRAGLLHDLLTRGLDPHGQLRDPIAHPEQFQPSPLGRIPKDWTVATLRHFLDSAEYGISTSLGSEGSLPVLRMNNLSDGEASLHAVKFATCEVPKTLFLRDGDVLFNRTNSYEHVGRTGIWRGQLPVATFASYLVRLNPAPARLTSEFLNLVLNMPESQQRMRRYATPAVQQVNINPTQLQLMHIAAPQLVVEQERIAVVANESARPLAAETAELAKLVSLKSGLMTELLTGRVRVPETVELVSASANGATSNQPGATPQVSERKPRKG